MITHEGYRRLLLDIEIYVDRIASAQINDLNALVSIARAIILAERASDEKDAYLRTLEAAYIEEDKYFTHRFTRIWMPLSQTSGSYIERPLTRVRLQQS